MKKPITLVEPSTKQKGIDLAKVRQHKAVGLSHREIAKLMGCSSQNIDYLVRIHGLELDGELCEHYKTHRADILAAQQIKVLGCITDEKLEKASARDLVIVYGTLFDKERLERGKSSFNILSYASIVTRACEED